MADRRPPPRPASPKARRRRFPSVTLALAGGAVCTLGAAAAVWLALREPAEATPVAASGWPAAVRPHTVASRPGAQPAGLPDSGDSAPGPDDGDEPAIPSDSGGLTRADVVAAIGAVRPELQRCGRDPSLIGVVRMTVASSGKVTSAQVFGGLAGTPSGECVAEVARGASFRPNRREQTVVSWPVSMGRTSAPVEPIPPPAP